VGVGDWAVVDDAAKGEISLAVGAGGNVVIKSKTVEGVMR